jgi:Flp pilus assembly CpaF family ATPase
VALDAMNTGHPGDRVHQLRVVGIKLRGYVA